MIGDSGVGKSSTVNHLFGQKVASINRIQSETKATTEYCLTINDDELAVQDLSLGIIDTPGFGDTEGLSQDACNLATIYGMMKDYPPLQHLESRDMPVFPNVVLLLVNATDNRIEGDNSKLAVSLKYIKAMKLVDTVKNNVLLVLTNVMSFSNSRKPQRWKEQLEEKSRKIQTIVENALDVWPEVIWVENHFYDEDAPDFLKSSSDAEEAGFDLEVEGDWTILPNGTKQILNLYEGMRNLLRTNQDNIALHTLNKLFRQVNILYKSRNFSFRVN